MTTLFFEVKDKKVMTEVTTTTTEESSDPIRFTDACVSKVKELLSEEENPNMPLRVFVQGGGCQGFQYGFQFEEAKEDDDAVIERGGVTFLVDPLSMQYLVGAEIDFKDELEGAQFVIRNPNAVTLSLIHI